MTKSWVEAEARNSLEGMRGGVVERAGVVLGFPPSQAQWQPGALAAPASDGPPPQGCSKGDSHLCPPPGTEPEVMSTVKRYCN